MPRIEQPQNGQLDDGQLAARFRAALPAVEPRIDPVTLAFEAGRATVVAQRHNGFWRGYSALSTAVAACLAVALVLPEPPSQSIAAPPMPAIADVAEPGLPKPTTPTLPARLATLAIDGSPGSRLTVMGVTEVSTTEATDWGRGTPSERAEVPSTRPSSARALLRRYLPAAPRRSRSESPASPTSPSEASAVPLAPRVA